ncbi:protein mono-ADP-ribosyltransferase PARP12-like [Haliotis rufescens]|uniref:protein mono-ADP-ribosyltransferase PARP12-like n=1 Tax=Haliotis rufescens TaxID=6454 RepID=UPI00201F79D8|nr:protein mono-ADP-ribosyltransferase PARP12-like [Haliotis rufescens]
MNPLEDTASSVQRGRRGLTQGTRELCEHFRRCSCSRLHHPKQAPYVWQYRVNPGGWKHLLSREMELVEKAFCNNEDEIEATVNISVPFEDILHPTPTDSDSGISFRRMSTRSYVEAGSEDISLYTQWVWYWQDNNGEWSPFMKPELQLTLETKYLAGQDIYLYTIGDHEYRLDFTSLVQVNRKYQTRRPVHRRPVFVSIDDARQRQQTCSSLLMSPAAVRAYRVPFNWTPLDRYQDSEMVDLAPSSDEYCTVMSSINKTLSLHKTFEVRHIYRLQNALLWYTYDCMKKTLQMSNDQVNIDERQLFHGTDTIDVVNDICINNFDFRVSGKNATVYGKGAYFARDARYSHLYTKGRRRYLFLARVLVGKYTLGDSTYTRPPRRKGHVRYDSCVDDKKNPSIFVIFERNQCYPEYLVEYKEISVEAESTLTKRSIRSATMSPPALSTSKTTNVRHLRPSTPPVVKTQAGYLTMDYSWTPSKTLPTSIPTSSGFSRNVRHLRPSTEAVVKTETKSLTLDGTSSKTTPTSIQPSSVRSSFVHDLSPSTTSVVKAEAKSVTQDLYGTPPETNLTSFQSSSARLSFAHDLSPSTAAVVKAESESLIQNLGGTPSKPTTSSLEYIRYFHPGIRAARDYIMGICCLTKNIILILILMHTLIDIK